jgi:hypothetical protein
MSLVYSVRPFTFRSIAPSPPVESRREPGIKSATVRTVLGELADAQAIASFASKVKER